MRLPKSEEGQGMVEYGLILGLISILCIVVLSQMGLSIETMLTIISGTMTAASTGS